MFELVRRHSPRSSRTGPERLRFFAVTADSAVSLWRDPTPMSVMLRPPAAQAAIQVDHCQFQTRALFFLLQCGFGCSYLSLCRIQRQEEERLKRQEEKRLKCLALNDGHSERIGLRRPSAALFTDTPTCAVVTPTIRVLVGGGPLPVLGRGSDRGERRPSTTALSSVRLRGGSGSGIPGRAPRRPTAAIPPGR